MLSKQVSELLSLVIVVLSNDAVNETENPENVKTKPPKMDIFICFFANLVLQQPDITT